jgi:hypothetical protein
MTGNNNWSLRWQLNNYLNLVSMTWFQQVPMRKMSGELTQGTKTYGRMYPAWIYCRKACYQTLLIMWKLGGQGREC